MNGLYTIIQLLKKKQLVTILGIRSAHYTQILSLFAIQIDSDISDYQISYCNCIVKLLISPTICIIFYFFRSFNIFFFLKKRDKKKT